MSDVSLEPKRFRDAKGEWRDIDNSVVRVDGADGVLKNAGGVFDVFFGSSRDGIRYVVEGREVTMRFDTDRVVVPVVDEVDRSTVWYRNVWDGVDASYTVHPSGVKEAFVVRDRGAFVAAGGLGRCGGLMV